MISNPATTRIVWLLASAALLFAGLSPQVSADAECVAEAQTASCCGPRACCSGCGENCQCRSPESPAEPAPVDLPKTTRHTVDTDTPRIGIVAIQPRTTSPHHVANFFDVLLIGDGKSLVARHVRLQI
jgi:hypothetical protein